MDLSLDPETLSAIQSDAERELDSQQLTLVPDLDLKVPVNDGLKAKLEKYIDFEAGGLKLLDLEIQGRPARFLVKPDIGKRAIWLQFQYRF